MNTASRITDHASDWTTQKPVLRPVPVDDAPSIKDLQALTVTLTGWYVAKPWSQLGMLATGTKAEEMNVSGKMSGKDMTWAVSLFGAESPTMANPQDRA